VAADGTINLEYAAGVTSPRGAEMESRMLDLGEARLKAMEADGITMQVLSLSPPGVQAFEPEEGTAWARRLNDELAEAVRRHPDKYVGLACVAPQSPDDAAAELERAVTKLGLKGMMLESHAGNEYLDDEKFRVIFATAERLDVPIYLHPDIPAAAILQGYADYGFILAGPPLGFGADAHLHAIRLIYSGLFDRYPRLRIMLGHMGEGLPFWLSRMDGYWDKPWKGVKPKIERKPSEYVRENFIATIGGMCFLPAFMCAYAALGADKIAFSVDYPYERTDAAVRFIKEAPIPDADKEKICCGNAARLFKL
jgi:2,3-dihydroxybenzoate decarboxylase